MLLTRTEFRAGVFNRDNHRCVICSELGQDAHHIMERRLWDDGGYYLDNGATLCDSHHVQAEKTLLTTEEIRAAANIEIILLPEHLYKDHKYDKWGNVILANGQRMRGELYHRCQNIVVGNFTEYVKYPRTYHLPWSSGTNDDKILAHVPFEGQEVVVTEKMDGENTTLYPNYLHTRSIDSPNHPSRNWIKNFHSKMGWQIPDGWRICGENLFAKHSIHYTKLSSYFMAFSIWHQWHCFSWDDTLEWCKLLGLIPVPVLYKGQWDEELIRNLPCQGEGYVVRLADGFSYANFRNAVAKYVRPSHVNTSHHWRFEKIVPNILNKKETL